MPRSRRRFNGREPDSISADANPAGAGVARVAAAAEAATLARARSRKPAMCSSADAALGLPALAAKKS